MSMTDRTLFVDMIVGPVHLIHDQPLLDQVRVTRFLEERIVHDRLCVEALPL